MQLQQIVNNVFLQLSESVEKSSQADYSSSCGNLNGATVGRHPRHIIEMFTVVCFDRCRLWEAVWDGEHRSVSSFTSPQAAL